MIQFSNRRSAAMMTSASVLVLAAIAPVAHAQQTDVGGPGKALTAGTISTTTGTVNDNGTNNNVVVITQSTPVVLVTDAAINNASGTALDIGASNGATGPITVGFAGVSNLRGTGTALQVSGVNQPTTVNTGSGNTFAAGQTAISANTQGGDLTIINGANTLSGVIGINATAFGPGTPSVVVNSTGGTIAAANYGIAANNLAGSVTVGQGAGVTTAITSTGANGTGVSAATTTGTAVSVRTGAGGTINGGQTGISATSNGAGAVIVNVGAVIGGTSAPTSRGVSVSSQGGVVVVNATAAITGGQNGINASTNGAGNVTVATNAVTSTSFDGVYLSTQTGAVNYTLNGANTVRGATGVTANATSGNISISAANAGSAITGNLRAVDARTSAGGSVAINLAGTTTGGIVGNVVGGAGSVAINAAGVNAVNDRGVSSSTTTGAITIATTGAVSGGQGGIYATSAGTGATTIRTASTVNGGTQSGIDSRNVGLGSASIGSANQRVRTVTGGTNGIFAASGGDVSIYAGTVTGGTRGVLATNQASGGSFQVNGAVLIDVTGTVTAANGQGVTAINNGALTSNTATIRAANVNSTGGSAVYGFANGGSTSITAGNITSAFANGTGWTGVYSQTNTGAVDISTGSINASFRGVDVESFGTGVVGQIALNTGAINGFQGIRAVSAGTGTINIGQTARIGAITTTGGAGVFATGAGDINVSTTTVSAAGGTAETLSTTANSPSITNATADVGFGIFGGSTGGAVNINASGATSSVVADAIAAQTSTPNGAINITAAGVTSTNARGIAAVAQGGNVSINSTGPINGGTFGIQAATNGAGAISILASGPVTSGSANGIAAVTTGLGAVTVGSANNRIGAVTANGASGTGITAFGAGDVSVYASSVFGGTRGIVAANQYNNPNGRVLIDVTGPVVGLNSWGVIGVNNGAFSSNSLTINTGDVTGTGRTAISAQTVGGDINITTTGAILSRASQTLTSNSSIFGEATGDGLITIDALGTVTGYDGIYTRTGGTGVRGGIDIFAANAVTGTNQYGIYAHTTGSNILIEAEGQVSGALAGVFGQIAGNGAVDIRTAGVTSSNGPAVFGQSGGAVKISTGAVTAAGGTGVTYQGGSSRYVLDASATSGFGVLALSSGGNVSLTSTGLVTGGAAGGVYGQTAGAGSITINTAAVTAAAGRGVEAYAAGGAINIASSGPINSLGVGIEANNSGAGSITVNSASTITAGAGANGIDAVNLGTGATSIGSANQRLGAITAGATGIFATSQGDVSVFASSVNAGTRGIVAASQSTAPNGVVTVNTTGAINAASGYGIVAVNNGVLAANTLAITSTGPIVSTGGSGISAQAAGGDITIRSGAVTANSAANGTWDGIFAESEGDSLISVATTGAVSGTYRGIDVSSAGTTARSGIQIAAGGNVSAGNGQAAIISTANGLGATTINTATGTTLNAVGGTGILANVTTATGANNVTVNNLAAIGGAGANRVVNGIVASISGAANSGNIAVNSSGGAIQASNAGILATTAGTGSINIGGTTGISSAITAPLVGISGSTTSGALTINTAAGGTIAPGATVGIQATTQTGAITINQAGSIGSAGAGNTVANGIYASIASGTGALNINSTGGIYITPGTGLQSAGIYAFNGGTGATNVVSSGVIDPGAYGVVVQGAGPVSYVANGGLIEGDQGVYVASTGAGPVTVTSTAGTTVRGLNGVGLQAVSVGGPVNVVSGGTVTGTTSGIVATTSGSGSTTITNTGAVTSGSGPAINAQSGTGGLTLNVRGDVISASGPAIVANSTGGGTINVASGAVVAGRVDSPTGSVIALNTASGTTSTINVAQGATVQAVSGSPFTTAIRATGGSVVVNNSGTISGQIDFSALTGANTGQLAGGAGTTFQTGGLSVFGAGNDTFTNAGQLVTIGNSTTFDFRGGTNIFNNNGQVFVGFSPVSAAGSTFLLSSLTTFNNAGSLNLMNGVLGDSIVAPGANYVGSIGARLMLDTAIIPGGRSDFLTVGTSSGVTSVVIRDTAPTSFGAYNPTGIVVVNGATRAGDFVLDNGSSFYNAGIFGGAIDKPGLFFSQLGVNGAGQTVLVSLPKVQAYQFSTLASQAQAVWYETTPRSARQAEVRDQLASGKGAGGFWVDVQGTHTARDVDRKSPTLAGIRSYDASYGQDVTAATIGYDAVRPMMNGDVVFGASVGYANSSADFDKQSTSVDMDGVSGSAYASFVRSGWFVAGTVGVSQLNAEIDAPRLAGFTQQETDITSVGATLEAGFRAPFIMGTTIEPTAALAYVNTSVDDFTAAGSTFRFEDGESLRPSIGARVSGDTGFGSGWTTRYNVSVRAVGEALSENAMTIGSAGPDLRVVDQFENAYGEVKAGLTSESVNGWSVFGDVTGRYSDEVRAVGASIGMRLRY